MRAMQLLMGFLALRRALARALIGSLARPALSRFRQGVRAGSAWQALHSALLVGMLSACTSPPSHFYTLGATPASATSVASARLSASPAEPASASTPPNAPDEKKPAWLIDIAPVAVPAQIARNQLVVQIDATQVNLLETQRWASLPSDEIRHALSNDIATQLNTFDVSGLPYPAQAPVYRITVHVQRFELWPGSRTVLDAVWSVRVPNTQTMLSCRTLAIEPVVGPGYDALIEGQRRAVAQMASDIAASVQGLANQTTKTGVRCGSELF